MKARRILTAVSAVALLSVAVDGTSAVSAQASSWSNQPQRSGGAWVDRLIERAFADVLRRSPDQSELRRYRLRVDEDHWTEDDIRADLRARGDYRSHTERSGGGYGSYDADRVIRTAYQDVLGRDPDPQGLRDYRRRMIDEGWTERQVRNALRDSQEHAQNPNSAADRIIRRAYQDVLGRAPDASGLASYRNEIVYHGWDEHDVREALMRSPEYREKNAMNPDKAREIVRRAYLGVLGREPDPASEGFVQKVLREHWSEAEVARELRNSDEYRNRQ